MTSPDPLADMVVARDGAIELLRAEIERQRRRIEYLESEIQAMHGTPGRPALAERPMRPWASGDERLYMLETEIERLRARVAELEAIVTIGHGTMGTLAPDDPATITHGHAPSAPPHDE